MNTYKIEVFTPDSNTCYNSIVSHYPYEIIINDKDSGFYKYWLPSNWSVIRIFDISSDWKKYEDIECFGVIEPIKTIENK